MYNQPDASLNSNYTFIGPDSAAYHTTYQDNKLYRYYDNQNLIGNTRRLIRDDQSKYQFPQTKTEWFREGSDSDMREYVEGDTSFVPWTTPKPQ